MRKPQDTAVKLDLFELFARKQPMLDSTMMRGSQASTKPSSGVHSVAKIRSKDTTQLMQPMRNAIT